MSCQVKVIEHSISPSGKTIATLQLRYWRAIHAEFMTHRMFSRNASSSRAIPVERMIHQVRNDPAGPIHWGANQPGMQARQQLDERGIQHAKAQWRKAANEAAQIAENLMMIGLHKQVANRVLEPFQYINVVVTATEWDNFFDLRCHPDAQPEIQELAEMMRDMIYDSIPTLRVPGNGIHAYHLPYITEEERELSEFSANPILACQVSAARCARTSYNKHDGSKPDIDEDLSLYDKLAGSRPLHASPCEHQARALHNAHAASGNFYGWAQFRKLVENELEST